MAKIAHLANSALADISYINPAFAVRPSLRDYLNPEVNDKLISEFFPLTPALKIIEIILKQLLFNSHERTHLIFGQPGIGKTFAAIVLANLLGQDPESPAMKALLNKINSKNPELASLIAQARRGGKRCLVIPVEKIQGNDNLRLQLLSALDNALFQLEIDYVPKASKSLIEIFQETFNHLINYPDLCGCAILIDNVDEYLEKDPQEFYEFLEFFRKQTFPCLLTTFAGIDRKLAAQMDGKNFDLVHNFSPISAEHDFEIFLGEKVLGIKSADYREALAKEREIPILLKILDTHKLYPDKDEEWKTQKLLLNNYPLHPVSLYALPRICEIIANAERNLRTFFLDEKVGSLSNLTHKLAFTQPNGRLSLYPLDSFYSYFEKNIISHPQFARYSMDQMLPFISDVPLAARIIRTIIMLEILNSAKLTTNTGTIIDAMQITPQEEKKIENALKILLNKEILEYYEEDKTYHLAKSQPPISPEKLIAEQIAALQDNYKTADFLKNHINPRQIEPAGFNRKFHTDKKILVKFLSPGELDPEAIDRDIEGFYNPQNIYIADLLVAYITPENPQEITELNEQLNSGRFNHPNLVIALPKQMPALKEKILEAEALRRILTYEFPFCEPDNPQRERLEQKRAQILESLNLEITQFLRADNFLWFWKGNSRADVKENQEEEYLSGILQELFSRFPALNGEILKHQENSLTQQSKKEIIELILSDREIALKENDSERFRQIVNDFLIPVGLLKETEPNSYRWNLSPAKDSSIYPIWQLFQETLTGEQTEKKLTEATEFLKKIIVPPFGLPRSFNASALAYFFQNYSDHLHIYRKKTGQPETLPSEDFPPEKITGQLLEEVINQPYKFFFLFFECRSEEKKLLDFIMEEFGSDLTLSSQAGIWERVQLALLNWYENLPSLTKNARELENKYSGDLLKLLTQIAQAHSMEAVLSQELLPALGFDPENFSWQSDLSELQTRLTECRENIERYSLTYRENLLKKICLIFNAGTPENLPAILSEWERNLNPETYLNPPTEEVKNLLWAMKLKDNPEELFFYQFSLAMGFPTIDKWDQDLGTEYLEKLAYLKFLAEYGMFAGAYSLPREKKAKAQKINDLLIYCLKSSEFSSDETREILEEMLGELAWKT